jgi:transposase
MGTTLVESNLTALSEQTVIVPGTTAADTVLPRLADSLKNVLAQRKTVAGEVEEIPDAHPLAKVGTSMPGIGVPTGALILLEIGDASSFASSGHLAAYAGIAPRSRISGSSIRGEHPARSGNRKLKRAFFLGAFAALSDPTSRAYYDRTRAEGKKTQRRPHLPRPTTLRRPLRHAPRQSPLPSPRRTSNCLKPLDKCHRDTTPGSGSR